AVIALTSHMASDLPPGWEIDRYLPQQVRLNLVEAQSRTFTVLPAFVNLERGLRIVQPTVVPDLLSARIKDRPTLYGPTVRTLPIDLDGYRRPGVYTFQVPLDLPPTVRPVKGFPSTVKVTFRIEK
ncbi:MAG TPA: hypothetical protein VIM58_01425, partial [Candidatus Methylacidiphilales bacterium]